MTSLRLPEAVIAGYVVFQGTHDVAPDVVFTSRPGEVFIPVVLGPDVVVRSGAVIYSGCHLGARTQVGHHAVLREHTVVGEDSIFGTLSMSEGNVRIGHHVMIQTAVIVQAGMGIDDYAFLGPRVTTTNDKYIRWHMPGMREELVPPRVGFAARIGAGAVLLPGVHIGANSFVGAGAVVTRHVPENAIVIGNPARILGEVPFVDRRQRT